MRAMSVSPQAFFDPRIGICVGFIALSDPTGSERRVYLFEIMNDIRFNGIECRS